MLLLIEHLTAKSRHSQLSTGEQAGRPRFGALRPQRLVRAAGTTTQSDYVVEKRASLCSSPGWQDDLSFQTELRMLVPQIDRNYTIQPPSCEALWPTRRSAVPTSAVFCWYCYQASHSKRTERTCWTLRARPTPWSSACSLGRRVRAAKRSLSPSLSPLPLPFLFPLFL